MVRLELEKMLEMGLIRCSHSAWISPIIPVPKKEGTVQFCVDYHSLNGITVVDPYPMPRIDDIDNLGEPKHVSTLDLTQG